MLLQVDNVQTATAEIESAGGRVTIQLGHDLLIEQFPGDFASKQSKFASASSHISHSAFAATLRNVEAYWKHRGDKLKPQPKVQKWTDKTAPISFPQLSPRPVDDLNSPYRQTMTGKIVVFVAIVSCPGSLAISYEEDSTFTTEVFAGLDFWTNQAHASAGLSFVMIPGTAEITAPDSTSCSSREACHNAFADPALEYLVSALVKLEGMLQLSNSRTMKMLMVLTLLSSQSIGKIILSTPTLEVDLCTCSIQQQWMGS